MATSDCLKMYLSLIDSFKKLFKNADSSSSEWSLYEWVIESFIQTNKKKKCIQIN